MLGKDTKKGKPFLEVLSATLHEDFRFPVLEVFAFLYVLGTFALASFGVISTVPLTNLRAYSAFSLVNSIAGVTSFSTLILLVLVLKNVAYGFGSDLERGTIQSYLTYPLKRRSVLTAKLVSALGVSLLLFVTVQTTALYIIAPQIVLSYFGTVVLSYLANFAYFLIVICITILLTMIVKKGAVTLIFGVILYFGLYISVSFASAISFASHSALALQIVSCFAPNNALGLYLSSNSLSIRSIWVPSYGDVLSFIIVSYAIVVALLALSYYYFSRRLNL
jgi:ABC-type transport system involved in multi-copper enzyme maturation permease subunit